MNECPLMHAAPTASHTARALAVNAGAFAFISENHHIEAIRRFVALPETLRS